MNPIPDELTNLVYFGYFALINQARLYVLIGKGEKSLEIIENFNMEIV